MNPEDFELPDPEDVQLAADSMVPKPNLRLYLGAMQSLRLKGYSYQEVADWLSEQLGATVTRSQVAYLLTTPDAVQEANAFDENERDRADEADAMP